jgi:hypothetical protein
LGVQIAMVRFNTVTIDQSASTVAIGAGLLWDDVYKALDGSGLNVVGGRVPGIGVAGLALGGGGYLSFSAVHIHGSALSCSSMNKRIFVEDEPVWTCT